MKTKHLLSAALVAVAMIVVMNGFFTPSIVQAEDDRDSRIEIGLEIAPVALNLNGKNRGLVGLGSYLVNAVANCNDCHSGNPTTLFLPGGNPYFGQQPAVLNPATYLSGGRDFGPLTPTPGAPEIVSRNLTPDKTGRPAGGRSFAEFYQILTTGVDLDHLHPTCSTSVTANCLVPPFDGNLLQIMPWPGFKKMGEQDIRAIYEYLSAVPCVAGPPSPSVLHNDCQ